MHCLIYPMSIFHNWIFTWINKQWEDGDENQTYIIKGHKRSTKRLNSRNKIGFGHI